VKEKLTYIGLGIVLGIIFSGPISRLPLVNRIPQA
jgi:hypothetical protein